MEQSRPDQNDKMIIASLEKELADAYALKFPWAGNLGRWEWDCLTGKVTYNAKKLRAIGYETGEIDPGVDDWTARIHPDDYEPTMENMRRHLYGKTEVYEVEYRIRHRDGSYRWFYDRGAVNARSPEGKPLRVGGIVFDISERKEKEARLKADLEFQERLLAIVSHDFRGPLGSILQLLRSFTLDSPREDLLELWQALTGGVQGMYQLMETLLEWARVNQGRTLSRDNLNLGEVARGQIDFLQPAAASKGVSFQVDAETGGQVLGDPVSLAVVVRNLLANAVKYSPTGTQITVSCEQRNNESWLTIADRGQGLSPAQIARLQASGIQASQAGTGGETGTGMGLKLCADLLAQNQGRLDIASQIGQGSRFSVVLPSV